MFHIKSYQGQVDLPPPTPKIKLRRVSEGWEVLPFCLHCEKNSCENFQVDLFSQGKGFLCPNLE